MKVDLIDYMGDDLMVVNAARVSFAKASSWENEEDWLEFDSDLKLKESDAKLIKYLASHGHWTPFAHPQITLRMKAPIFVRTQCFKHKQGFVENEVSRRYVDEEPKLFTPDVWRGRPTNGAKQGSSEDTVESIIFHGIAETWEDDVDVLVHNHYATALNLYDDLIAGGVAPEQARMILPQSMYTEWYWTGSLAAYARFYKQRSDSHAQQEIQELAKQVDAIVRPLFPISWRALTE